MTGDELKAWREGLNFSQADAGAALGVARATINRAETMGGKRVSAVLELAHKALMEPAKPEKAARAVKPLPAVEETLDEWRLPSPYDFKKAPAFTTNLRRYPDGNAAFKADAAWDKRPCSPGWQRVPGCVRIVHEDIPDPIPFFAPTWAGVDGVQSGDGRVFHADTGKEMKRGAKPVEVGARVPFQKAEKKPKR